MLPTVSRWGTVAALVLAVASSPAAQEPFLRGDGNGDGRVDITDAIYNLTHLFSGGGSRCLDAQDTNDDGEVNITDPVYNLQFLFQGGEPPPEPFAGGCGLDPTAYADGDDLGCLVGCDGPARETSPWPMFRHDALHTGRTSFSGPSGPDLAWVFQAGDGIVSSPSIGADGTIYFGARWFYAGSKDPRLYALRPDGSLKWSLEAGDGFFSSPAIGPDGLLYLSGLDGFLYAIEDRGTEGRVRWRTDLGYGFSLSSPLVGPDGTIYVGSPSFHVHAVRPDGEIRWSYKTGWCVISSPALDSDGTLYIGSKDHRLYAFGLSDPRPRWLFEAGTFYDGHLVDSSPAIGADSTIYFGTDPYGAAGYTGEPTTSSFWAARSDGSLKWSFETGDGVESSPAIAADGTVYFGSYDGHLYAVEDRETEGALRWRFETGGAVDGSPTVDGNGAIYFGSRDSYVYSLRPDGSLRWRFQTGDGIESSPTIDGRGFLYIGSFDGKLYALGTGRPDVGVSGLDVPAEVEAGAAIQPAAILRNYRSAASSFEVACRVEQGSDVVYSEVLTVTLPGGASQRAAFAPWIVAPEGPASYDVRVETRLADDETPENDTATVTVTVP